LKNNQKQRIGITGSTGVTGRTLMSQWKDDTEFLNFKGDITKKLEVREWYDSVLPLDGLIHLAALVPVHLVEADPMKAFEINVLGTLNLLEEVRRLSEKIKPWMFYSSTSHVYATSNDPISEDTPIDPINMYGETKAQGDKWCQIYMSRFGLPICKGRIFSCSSP
jgi:nucleoside-diphosphate-sugar epimerase